jgi:hypothetical protein
MQNYYLLPDHEIKIGNKKYTPDDFSDMAEDDHYVAFVSGGKIIRIDGVELGPLKTLKDITDLKVDNWEGLQISTQRQAGQIIRNYSGLGYYVPRASQMSNENLGSYAPGADIGAYDQNQKAYNLPIYLSDADIINTLPFSLQTTGKFMYQEKKK